MSPQDTWPLLQVEANVFLLSLTFCLISLSLYNFVPLDIAAGAYHSLALTTDGVILAWGLNNHGQLGFGHLDPVLAPTPISLEGASHSGLLPRFMALAAGEHHSVALTDTGIVYAWGRADSGQLALSPFPNPGVAFPTEAIIYHKEDISHSNIPAAVTLPRPIDTSLFGGRPVTAVASGSNHVLAITNNNLFSWGFGDMLQLGNGKEQDEPLPIQVKLSGKPIQADAGGQHSIVLISS
jgi:regulator of chromosome condensation